MTAPNATGARTTWNGHCGRRSIEAGTVLSYVDEWYEQGERGDSSVVDGSVANSCPGASSAADEADVLDRIRRHVCVPGGALAASPGIGVIPRVGSRLGTARNSAAEMARGDIM